jgi:platelet-activating factor acetylhydrolase
VPTSINNGEKAPSKHGKKTVDYKRLSHTPSPEVEEGRNEQLKIRLWELGLIHDSLLKVDEGQLPKNLNTSSISLSMFENQMDVHTAGKITFAGHSFGSATVTQFVKSTYYSPQTSQAPKEYQPLFTPSSRSSIAQQITPETPVILLDVWCLPLRAKSTRWLWDKPFPCYTEKGPGGEVLLAVESQAFYKWRVHLKTTKRLLSADPSSESFDYTRKDGKGKFSQPHFYYAESSAHLSQSDFGILFPWLIKKFLAVEEPERVMLLNTRAILQLLRSQRIEVSLTSAADMELEGKAEAETKNDLQIFGTNEEVRGWNFLDTCVTDMTDVDEEASATGSPASNSAEMATAPSKVVIGNELMKENPTTTN